MDEPKKLVDVEDIVGTFLKGDVCSEAERYKKTIDTIYIKLRPIWVSECKDAMWLLQDEFIREVAEILYLDDQIGGNLDPSSLSEERQNLLSWKQVQSAIEKYQAANYSVVDDSTIKAILSGIIKNKKARDADRLKAIEQYTALYGGEGIEGVSFLNDLYRKSSEDDRGEKGDE